MRRIIAAICARMERNVVAANDYRIGKDTGAFDSIVDKMWETLAHEVARLPMIYAIGADLTGDRHWKELAHRYAPEAAAKSKEASTKIPYALLQQQVSLDALYQLEESPELKRQWLEAMRLVADRAQGFPGAMPQYQVPGRHRDQPGLANLAAAQLGRLPGAHPAGRPRRGRPHDPGARRGGADAAALPATRVDAGATRAAETHDRPGGLHEDRLLRTLLHAGGLLEGREPGSAQTPRRTIAMAL